MPVDRSRRSTAAVLGLPSAPALALSRAGWSCSRPPPCLLLKQFEHLLEPWMAADRVEIGVILHPPLSFPGRVGEKLHQKVDCSFVFTHQRAEAGHVVFLQTVVGINHQSTFRPFLGTVELAESC